MIRGFPQALKPVVSGWRSPCHSAGRQKGSRDLCQRRAGSCRTRTPAHASGGNSGNHGNGGGHGGRGDGRGDGGDDDNDFQQHPFAAAGFVMLMSGALCLPARAGPPPKSPTDDLVDQLVDLIGPIASNLGFSGALGLAAAIALKMVGKAVAVVIGLAFVLVQGLAHFGLVTVHWSEVREKATKLVDSDGDGDFDKDDMRKIGKQLIGALSEGVPSIGGFCAGFLMGLKIF